MRQGQILSRHTHSQGFSLLELMIVIAIIAIMTGIAIPNFISSRPRAQIKKATRDLYSNMQLAKVKALRDSSEWAIQFNTAADSYDLLSAKGADDTWNTGDDTVFKTVELDFYPGIVYGSLHGPRPGSSSDPSDGVSFGSNRLEFNPDGSSSSGTVYFNNDDDTCAVGAASSAGRIKAWHNYGGGWTDG